MPFVAVTNTARVELVFTQNGQVVENVYHVAPLIGGFTPGALAAVAGVFKAWWVAHLQVNVVPEVSLIKMLVTDLSAFNGEAIEYVTGLPLAGGNANNLAFPNNVTVAIKWLTAKRGRSYRGRTYHVGLPKSGVVESELIADEVTILHDAYQALLPMLGAMTPAMRLGVVSYIGGKSPRVLPLLTEITGVFVDPTVDSQRRRLPGRGA